MIHDANWEQSECCNRQLRSDIEEGYRQALAFKERMARKKLFNRAFSDTIQDLREALNGERQG